MGKCQLFCLLVLSLVCLRSCNSASYLHDSQNVHDEEHIKEHVQQLLTEEELKALSKEQLEFYYFKLHDYDNNNKLDGLEMLGAMTHHKHKKDGEEHVTTLDEGLSEDILTEAVDASLKAADSNDDGYIEYHEYYNAIRRREAIAEKQEKDAL